MERVLENYYILGDRHKQCHLNVHVLQWTLFITTFVITANFVITSIWSAQKSADRVFFIDIPILFFRKKICFVYLLESPRRGDSNKYTKRMIHKKLFKSIRYSCFRRVHIKFLYNSKFDFTAKSLVTGSAAAGRGDLFSRKRGSAAQACYYQPNIILIWQDVKSQVFQPAIYCLYVHWYILRTRHLLLGGGGRVHLGGWTDFFYDLLGGGAWK